MLNIEQILKKSWQILWSYRVLWIFGLLVAFTSPNGVNNPVQYRFDVGERLTPPRGNAPFNEQAQEFYRWATENLAPLIIEPSRHIATIAWIVGGFFILVVVLSLAAALIRYPAETAMLRMVNDHEGSGTRHGFRDGWRLGWNRRAFRLWVIDLIIGLPAFLFLGILLFGGLWVFFNLANSPRPSHIPSLFFGEQIPVFGILFAIGVFVMVIVLLTLVMTFLGLLRQFISRAAAFEGLGVAASFRSGWALFRRQWKNASLMWLVMLGVGIAFGLVAMVLFFLLIPLYVLLLIPAGVVGLLPGLLVYGLTSLFAAGPPAWIAGGIVGAAFFFMVLFSPLYLIGGWYKIYEASAWTLAYRDMKNLASTPTVRE